MDDTIRSCREFTSLLGSNEPTPGGGGAAALSGALGAALCTMVASLTVGKKQYAAVESEVQTLLRRCKSLQDALLDAVALDAEGFLPLAAVYAMPKDDPNRPVALQKASEAACDAPLRMMTLCLDALDAARRLAEIGSRLAVSDAGCAAALLHGALRAASLNVRINTKTMPDRETAQALNDQCDALLYRGTAQADAVFERVARALTMR